LGIGDWGLGIGDWAQSPIPNPQSPIPNPHISFFILFINIKIYKKRKYILKIYNANINKMLGAAKRKIILFL